LCIASALLGSIATTRQCTSNSPMVYREDGSVNWDAMPPESTSGECRVYSAMGMISFCAMYLVCSVAMFRGLT
jgi:hypothetical protein